MILQIMLEKGSGRIHTYIDSCSIIRKGNRCMNLISTIMHSFVPYLIDLRVASRTDRDRIPSLQKYLTPPQSRQHEHHSESSAAFNIVRCCRRRPPARTCIIIKVLCFDLR